MGSQKDVAMELFPNELLNITTLLLVKYSPKQNHSQWKMIGNNKFEPYYSRVVV